MMDRITIRGARQHNLKRIDVDIPRNQLVVITGLSGSGKSTLAFDTLYAEGQRRYVESLSPYARQFLERMPKPRVDVIEGLSPAIAIEQKTASHNPRSTVGTVTEIYDHLRLLFARIGIPHCHQCGAPVVATSVDQMVDTIMALDKHTRVIVMAPMVAQAAGPQDQLIDQLRRDGFARVRINGEIVSIEHVPPFSKDRTYSIEVIVDRLVVKPGKHNRMADSLELAMGLSNGSVVVEAYPPGNDMDPETLYFNERAICPRCDIQFPALSPSSFSFNSPHGACPACDGLGIRPHFDVDKIIPDPRKSIEQGAILPWATRHATAFKRDLERLARQHGTTLTCSFNDLPEAFIQALLHGNGVSDGAASDARENRQDIRFEGVIAQLDRRYHGTESRRVREEIRHFISFVRCPDCDGTRLRAESRAVRIQGKTIHELCALPVPQAVQYFRSLRMHGQRAMIARKIIGKIIERLEFLQDVGLGYLTLDRSADTLSGGESQRIRLATQIGARLTGILYVLDEPSIGLHPRDTRKLWRILKRMRDMGNTILVVEHDPDTIRSADFVIDMGPGAGEGGGEVIFAGPGIALLQAPDSLTAKYLSGRRTIAVPSRRRDVTGHHIRVMGASCNNLKSVNVSVPLGCLVCVTGVSGSGKSSLVIETLFEAAVRRLRGMDRLHDGVQTIEGLGHIDHVININQAPIGRTPRSNPATYTGLFGPIRDIYAKTPEARVRGYKPGRFSFNVKGGRCEACKGEGTVKIEMHFLPDVYVPCDICSGKRYNRETLEVRYKGHTITDVLDMSVNQALACFGNIRAIRDKLQTLVDVGLGYIRLGQPGNTLSGGEAQRIKLAKELSKRDTGRTLYILDEPTSGLHMEDISQLLAVLNRLVNAGNTVVVIEHNLDVIKTADFVIDLGPEGGDGGGYVVATGAPEELAMQGNSYTGQYLKKVLGF